jgi:hypothetical protein
MKQTGITGVHFGEMYHDYFGRTPGDTRGTATSEEKAAILAGQEGLPLDSRITIWLDSVPEKIHNPDDIVKWPRWVIKELDPDDNSLVRSAVTFEGPSPDEGFVAVQAPERRYAASFGYYFILHCPDIRCVMEISATLEDWTVSPAYLKVGRV